MNTGHPPEYKERAMSDAVVSLRDLRQLLDTFAERFQGHEGESLDADGTPVRTLSAEELNRAAQMMTDLSTHLSTVCVDAVLLVRLQPTSSTDRPQS
jgi:hypothetical protein